MSESLREWWRRVKWMLLTPVAPEPRVNEIARRIKELRGSDPVTRLPKPQPTDLDRKLTVVMARRKKAKGRGRGKEILLP